MGKKINQALISRLQNWKFSSALKYIDNEDENTQRLIHSLADTFGDCGWILDGNMSIIINNALENIGIFQ
jgi:hypothetical protein